MNTLGNVKVRSVLAPADSGSTVTEAFTTPIDVGECTELEFDVSMGVTTDDTIVFKVYKDANTTTSSGGVAIAFTYKLTGIVATDTDGAWTASASTGYTLPSASDGKLLRINVDPALCDGYPYVYLGIDPGSSVTAFPHSVTALAVLRYNQSVPPSVID